MSEENHEKQWGGRFSEKTHPLAEAFTSSILVDRRLYRHDIQGSIAHVKTLLQAGILTQEETDTIVSGLSEIEQDIADGNFSYSDALEDIHMHIESALKDRIGEVAKKLHTGRSRNDQVALDTRLYLKAETGNLILALQGLQLAITEVAEKEIHTVMPGYTHLQRAQPVLLSHHLMAYYEMFKRDEERMEDCRKRTDVMPLGSAALAGTTYPLDREYTAGLLGFHSVSRNSMDAVSDRDFVMEFLFCAGLVMTHLSRLSEEIILWSSKEFSFVELPDAFATGSSIMPQKKNPDIPELVRGKTGKVYGHLVHLLTLMKSLPLTYNRDMQEDKLPLFDTVDTVSACIEIYTKMLPKLRFNSARMRESAQTGYLDATDLADYLVAKGISFRRAHEISGKAVAFGIETGKELHELSLDELKGFSEVIEEDVYSAISLETMINRRATAGGTAIRLVQKAIDAAKKDNAFKRNDR